MRNICSEIFEELKLQNCLLYTSLRSLQTYTATTIIDYVYGDAENGLAPMPEDYMGDVIGDINSRRGRIEGMEDIGGGKMVRAYVPLSEMFGYSTDLRSRTQGRGNYSMFFDKYEPVPKNVQEKVLSDHKK